MQSALFFIPFKILPVSDHPTANYIVYFALYRTVINSVTLHYLNIERLAILRKPIERRVLGFYFSCCVVNQM